MLNIKEIFKETKKISFQCLYAIEHSFFFHKLNFKLKDCVILKICLDILKAWRKFAKIIWQP